MRITRKLGGSKIEEKRIQIQGSMYFWIWISLDPDPDGIHKSRCTEHRDPWIRIQIQEFLDPAVWIHLRWIPQADFEEK